MFELKPLKYASLAPVIGDQTLACHYGKHLKAYVDNLNKLVVGTEFAAMPLEEIVCKASGAIFNNAGQVLNHELYFEQFASVGASGVSGCVSGCSSGASGGASGCSSGASGCASSAGLGASLPAPTGNLAAQIAKQWGSFEAFQAEFEAKGAGLFGSGWVWLSAAEDGTLVISQEAGASNPVVHGHRPLLTFDVWEHAYYLDYQNRRADYLHALWQLIDWSVVEGRYGK